MNTLALRLGGPVLRLTVGLVALILSLLMVLDLVFGVIPSRASAERELRQRFAETLAVQMASLAEVGDERTLGKTLEQVVARSPDVRSIALRQSNGYLLAQRGDHARYWVAPREGRSTLDHVRVPIHANRAHWGDIEIAFAPAQGEGVRGWLREPAVLLGGALCLGGALLIYLYLRRALHYLDPTAAVPDRVRKAFDALSDGVAVVAPDGRIALANATFRRVFGAGGASLHGQKLSALKPFAGGGPAAPWEQVLKTGQAIAEVEMAIPVGGEQPLRMLVGATPISDRQERVRGCLVSFNDVTELHRTNERLRETLADLERSREQIRAQNEELRVLATRDPLTGCLNRRAFFAAATALFAEHARGGGALSCVMVDIDHFKGYNDRYGHAVGDQVIQVVARTLSAQVRVNDLLCRYGGEEFCLIFPAAEAGTAQAIAQRMRAEIEAHASAAVRATRVERITASFGVATLGESAIGLEALIDRADQALYQSKQTGRNRVTLWQPEAA